MTAVPVTERMTAEQFLALPERPEGSRRLDLVDGEVVVSEPRWRHNVVQRGLLFAIEAWTRTQPGRGTAGLPLDVKLDDRNVYEPDVVWYAEGREPGLEQFPFALPDLAVEVLALHLDPRHRGQALGLRAPRAAGVVAGRHDRFPDPRLSPLGAGDATVRHRARAGDR